MTVLAPELIPQQLVGDLRRGGYLLTGYVEGDTDAVSKGANWLLQGKSGSDWLDLDWRQFFTGHLLGAPDNLQFDAYNSRAVIRAGTMNELLIGESLQAIGFTEQSSPANEHQITGMQLADIVEHIIKHHCNVIYHATDMPDGVITSTDIDTTNSVPLERYNVSKSENLWRSLQSIGGGEEAGEFYRCWFDRSNTFHYQAAPAFWATPPTSLGTLTKSHIRGQMQVKLRNNNPGETIGKVRITAIKNSNTIYTASSPSTPGDGQELPPRDGIWADTQSKADTQATRLYDWLTRAFTVTLEVDPGLILFGDDGSGIDLADKVAVTYDGPTEDAISGAGVHLNWSAKAFFVYGVRITFDIFGRMAQGLLILEEDPS